MLMEFRHGFTWDRLWNRISFPLNGFIFFCFAAALVSVFASFLFTAGKVETHNGKSNANQRIEKLFHLEGQSPEDRKVLAGALLDAAHNGLVTDLTSPERSSEEYSSLLASLQSAHATGELSGLDTSIMTYDKYVHETIPSILLGSLLCMMLSTSLVYFFSTFERSDEFIADFEWRRVWPVCFVLFTLLPIGWLFYAASAIHIVWYRRKHPSQQGGRAVETEVVNPTTLPDDVYDDLTEDMREIARRMPHLIRRETRMPTFSAAPQAARSLYQMLRINAGRKYIAKRLEVIESERSDVEDNLQYYGERVKDLQKQKRDIIAEQRKLEAVNPDDVPVATAEELNAEFDRLMHLNGVAAVGVVNDQISVLVKARYTWDGRLFDLGDWELRFGVGTSMWSKELRSGVHPDWRGSYPVYRLGYDNFCFGNQQSDINQHLLKGQMLEAVEVAVNALNSINENDERYVQEAFYEIQEMEPAT